MTTVSTPHSVNQSTNRWRSVVKVPKQLLAPVRDLPLRQPCVWSPQRQWRLRSGASLATFGRPWTSIFCGSSPILLLTSAEGLGCAIHQIPKRDRRGGVTTLKCATAHGPCFLTGSHATKIISAAPFRAQSSPSVSTPQGARSAEIGFLDIAKRPLPAKAIDRLRCSSAEGDDEEAIQCRRRADQRTASQDAEA